MNIVLGATGQLGSYISKHIDERLLKEVSRQELASWIHGGGGFIRKNLEKIISSSHSEDNFIYYCVGETNSTMERGLLEFINYSVPLLISENIKGLPLRLVTFGSIHESTAITNPYMDSKKKLYRHFMGSQDGLNWSHIQLHTLYSEIKPRSHMFLGQILDSLKREQLFEMSSGLQVRQFHHTEDIVKIIAEKIFTHEGCALEEINGPEFISLRDLAEFLFREFDMLNLLRIGARADEVSEVFFNDHTSASNIDSRLFRDMKSGILQMLKLNLVEGT